MSNHVPIKCKKCGNEFGLDYKSKAQITNPYKQAVWDFMLDHAHATKKGNMYVAFNITTIENFEGRVYARRDGYRREWNVPKIDEVKESKAKFHAEKFGNIEKRVITRMKKKSLLLRFALWINGFNVDK